jgi:hypothetical protein
MYKRPDILHEVGPLFGAFLDSHASLPVREEADGDVAGDK